jgi:nicotinamide phosphoribosyltransferase
MIENIILNTDSYKASHFSMYPPGCQVLSCYIESRGGPFTATVFFGLQAFLMEYLSKPIDTKDIDEADEILGKHGLPFHRTGWQYILDQHNGYLPIEIEAVPEGTIVPTHNVLLQIRNTDPACYWLPTYLETALLRAIWYPTTVATVSFECKQILRKYLEETADTLDILPFQLHDFGARGVSSYESAALGGLSHLVNFSGTDTIAAILAAKKYYSEPMAGFSIPAAEHSTIISWGKKNERNAYEYLLETYSGNDKRVSIVCDSYDIWNTLKNTFGRDLKNRIENNAGRIIFRPDSGKPEEVVVKVIEMLMQSFGYRMNQKGYRVLPDNIRVLQGDGVTSQSMEACLQGMKVKQLSAENIVFGMGGALLQRVHRDTAQFAMKVSAAKINNEWINVNKEPATDAGKISKAGQLALIKDGFNSFKTILLTDLGDKSNYLRPVYKNGKLLVHDNLETIRRRTNACEFG